jgi:hypothetical protein
MMDAENHILFIKKFSPASKAKDYCDFVNQDAKVFKDLLPSEYSVFAVSPENFATFYKEKDVAAYRKFFTENYGKKKEE